MRPVARTLVILYLLGIFSVCRSFFMNGGRPTAGAPQNRPLTAKAAETPSPPPRNTNTPDSAPAHATGLGQDANIEASAAAMVAATGEANTVERDRISSDTATATKAGPTHLVVLVHGLGGTPEDLTYLKETLERRGGPGTLVHLAKCNKGRTKDGVAEGGTRLANEVLGVVDSTPSLSRISLVGNSLGGLYARYAAKVLYREEGDDIRDYATSNRGKTGSYQAPMANMSDGDAPGVLEASGGEGRGQTSVGGTVAGLKPAVFMSIAAPHLGVRRFTYVPVPSSLQGLAGVFVGKTGSDLFLASSSSSNDKSGQTASSDQTATASFSNGKAFGNISAESAARAAESGPGAVAAGGTSPAGAVQNRAGGGGVGSGSSGGQRQQQLENDKNESRIPLLYDMATSEEFLKPLRSFSTRRAYANRRGDFMVPYETAAFVESSEEDGADAADGSNRSTTAGRRFRMIQRRIAQMGLMGHVLGARQGSIVATSRVPSEREGGLGERQSSGGLEKAESAATGQGQGGRDTFLDGVSGMFQKADREMEEEMAAGLNSCGWQKVSVDFGGLLPLSHNKICALSRSPLAAALYGSGKNIMDHAADFLIAGRNVADPEREKGVANDNDKRNDASTGSGQQRGGETDLADEILFPT